MFKPFELQRSGKTEEYGITENGNGTGERARFFRKAV